MIDKFTLSIRPSLALPSRWSVDYWLNDRCEASYQLSLVTFPSLETALKFADRVQATLETDGIIVQRVQENENASRHMITRPEEVEEEIKKRVDKYIEKSFEPIRKFSVASLFNISNWAKGVKAIATRSPLLLSILVLAALLIGDPVEQFLASLLPTELAVEGAQLLAASPLLIVATALFVYFNRTRTSIQLDRMRQWILQLAVFFSWDRDKFSRVLQKELRKLEYASVTNMFQAAVKRDPSSFTNLVNELAAKSDESEQVTVENLRHRLLCDDFARKIQALVGIAGEPYYRPKHLAINPFLLLISLSSLKSTLIGLLGGNVASLESSRRFQEGMALIGMMLGLLLSLVVVLVALIWTTVLAWGISPVLFGADLIALMLTVWLLTSRPLAVILQRRFVPRGLGLHECIGALNI